ncbi:basic proline-rich protein-like [Haemorhous mexicanus]|uniref:basic proline-rich protein-like n=1 Tax=Haemorhous mexicanus TaxID=30427 RepID=UPI0028BEDC33|nr:basic proline-rich protein-like [Haemorhous mexicanus]
MGGGLGGTGVHRCAALAVLAPFLAAAFSVPAPPNGSGTGTGTTPGSAKVRAENRRGTEGPRRAPRSGARPPPRPAQAGPCPHPALTPAPGPRPFGNLSLLTNQIARLCFGHASPLFAHNVDRWLLRPHAVFPIPIGCPVRGRGSGSVYKAGGGSSVSVRDRERRRSGTERAETPGAGGQRRIPAVDTAVAGAWRIPAVDTGTARAPGPGRPDTRGSQRWTPGNHSDEHWSQTAPAHITVKTVPAPTAEEQQGCGDPTGHSAPGTASAHITRRSDKGAETPPDTPLQRPPPAHITWAQTVPVPANRGAVGLRRPPPPFPPFPPSLNEKRTETSRPLPVTGEGGDDLTPPVHPRTGPGWSRTPNRALLNGGEPGPPDPP